MKKPSKKPLHQVLKSPDLEERDEAFAIIADTLANHAHVKSPSPYRVNAQADSVVQSVLVSFLVDPVSFANDEHLWGHLKQKVNYRIRQRVDPRAGINKSKDLEHAQLGAGATHSNPASMIAHAELDQIRRDVIDEALAQLRPHLKPEDWAMLRARVVDAKSWAEIAESAGISENLARVRWHRLLPQIRSALAEAESQGEQDTRVT